MPSGTADPDFVLRGAGSSVTALAFTTPESDQQQQLVSGLQNGKVVLWNMLTRRAQQTLELHGDNSVLGIKVLEGHRILTHGRDGSLAVLEARQEEWAVQHSLHIPAALGFCACEVFNHGNQTVVATSQDSLSQIQVSCLATGKQIGVLQTEAKRYGMCMGLKTLNSDDCSKIFAGYEDGGVVLWDIRMWKEMSRCTLHPETIMAFDYCSETNKGVSVSTNECISIWKVNKQTLLEKITEISVSNSGFASVKYRPDGKLYITGGWDGKARIFSGKKNTPLAILDFHKDSIQSINFSLDNRIALGSKDSSISIWSLYT